MTAFLLEAMQRFGGDAAVIRGCRGATYQELLDHVEAWRRRLVDCGARPGQVVSVEGDYGPSAIAAFLALTLDGYVVVPLSPVGRAQHESFRQVAMVQWRLVLDGDEAEIVPGVSQAEAPHYQTLRRAGHPGLVLFSSGSTGQPKAAVHDLSMLLNKFRQPRRRMVTLVFLQLDHIGGINTLFYTLSNGGTVVVAVERSPEAVCRAIAEHAVELLPTSPTFLNLLLLSGELERHDLSSLKLVTYGTEPMPQSTLDRLAVALPQVDLLQTYGMTELGILRSKSRGDGSLWVRVGGEGFETKVVNGRLHIRAESAMLGYLNAPSPFDEEGFFDTGDLVETDGPWLRILGRQSEVINVGGRKVHPAEVEGVLLEIDGVLDAIVTAEPNPLTGQIVTATVHTDRPWPAAELKALVQRHCRRRLEPYKVPLKVHPSHEPLHSERFKRMRGRSAPADAR